MVIIKVNTTPMQCINLQDDVVLDSRNSWCVQYNKSILKNIYTDLMNMKTSIWNSSENCNIVKDYHFIPKKW